LQRLGFDCILPDVKKNVKFKKKEKLQKSKKNLQDYNQKKIKIPIPQPDVTKNYKITKL